MAIVVVVALILPVSGMALYWHPFSPGAECGDLPMALVSHSISLRSGLVTVTWHNCSNHSIGFNVIATYTPSMGNPYVAFSRGLSARPGQTVVVRTDFILGSGLFWEPPPIIVQAVNSSESVQVLSSAYSVAYRCSFLGGCENATIY